MYCYSGRYFMNCNSYQVVPPALTPFLDPTSSPSHRPYPCPDHAALFLAISNTHIYIYNIPIPNLFLAISKFQPILMSISLSSSSNWRL